MVEVKRKTGESVESMLRRFTRRMQQSRILIRVKDNKFYRKPKTKRKLKDEALRRKDIKSKKEYLRRIGRLTDEAEDQAPYKRKTNRVS